MTGSCNAYLAADQPGYLEGKVVEHYGKHAKTYSALGPRSQPR